MKQNAKRLLAMLLTVVMLLGAVPMSALAAGVDYTPNSTSSTDGYYNLISKKDWDIAPGITESEIVLNNDDGSYRQVLFVMEADLNNEYVKVINSYNGMVPQYGSYKTGVMSEQAAYAEANGYGNVVGAMNTTLSWYTNYPADRVGEPLGFIMLDAEVLFDPANCGYEYGKVGFPSVLVINKDFDENGNPRPADIPKVEMPQITSAADLDGWEEQVIPCSSGYIVKDGVNQSSPSHTGGAPRSVVGIKPDGTVVIMLNDGRQAPYSEGMSMYELAEVMLDLGCSYAVNCDGGGSSTYLSQRPGEELKVNNSPSDGAERPTTTGILFITTAPADGAFARATIFTDNTYYTPGSTVKFDALGTDLVGTEAEIPADVSWQLADASMGTIENGVFVSNGKVGTVTAQMVYNGKVVGEHSIEIVVPTEFSFSQAVMTVPFGKEITIGLNATINEGRNSVTLKAEDVIFETTNEALGSFNGLQFTAVDVENAPENLKSTLTATLVHNTELVTTAELNLGKGSEILFDFEEASDIDEWNIADVNGNDKGFYQHVSFATAADGKVHNGNGSMRVEMNPISATGISNGGYGQSDLFLDQGVVVENAKSIGFWAYIPDEYEHCWIRVLYWYDPDGDGKFDKKNTISVISQPEVYNTVDESGWRYFSVDVSAYSKILIPGRDCKDKIAYNASKNDANNFRFIEFMFPHTNTNDLWKTYGTINGLQTVYIDNITADFSDAINDREAPVFGNVELLETEKSTVLGKYNTVTTTSNLVSVTAAVQENTAKTNATGLNAASAKAYIDGVEVPVAFTNNRMTISDVAVANGTHRVKFEISDNMGNKSVVIRLIKVDSAVDASTIQVVPASATLDDLYGGSVYWMNMNANKIETIKSVKAVIDLNYGNHWELDHIELAAGFTSEYTIDKENNTATITITRTGENTQNGAATLAALPIRVIYYDTDINIEGYTAETYWNTYGFWPYDLKVDVDMGAITYVDGFTSDVLGAFSNEEFSVDTELQTAFSDAAFKAERGTSHVHNPAALEDKAATCTEAGYTGRTYCEVCESVVEWGTSVPALGHAYEVNGDGKLACVNGGEFFSGVHTDGKTYVDGVVMTDGWVEVDGVKTYYYLGGVMLTGSHFIDGVMYTFDDDGVYLPDYKYDGWYETDDTVMFFIANEYLTGSHRISNVFYLFDENGKGYEGEYEFCGVTVEYNDGLVVENEEVLYAGFCGEDVRFVILQNGHMIVDGTGPMDSYSNVSQNPWYGNAAYRNSVTSLYIGKEITTVGSRAFMGMDNLKSVEFAEGSEVVQILACAFLRDKNLTEIVLPEKVWAIGSSAFQECSKLKYVYVPANVHYLLSDAFYKSNNVVLHVADGSIAMNRAIELGIKYEVYIPVVASGSCGENLTWVFYENGTLKIQGSGAMNDYNAYDSNLAPWRKYNAQIKKIVIGNEVTYLGKFAFYSCSKLTTIEFEENSTLVTIGWGAFGACNSLKSVVIPASVKQLNDYAFYNCPALESVDFAANSKLNTIGDYAFWNDTALKTVFIPNGVLDIKANAFYATGSVTLSVMDGSPAHTYAVKKNLNFVTRPAEAMVLASGECGASAEWEFYNDGTLKIQGSGAMNDYNAYDSNLAPWRKYNAQIKKIVIGNEVTYLGKFAFYGCSKLTTIEFEAGSRLATIGWGAFGACNSLKSVVIPASVKQLNDYAFYNCPALETVDFAANSKLNTIGDYAFWNDTALKTVFIPNGVLDIKPNAFYATGSVTLSVMDGSPAHTYAVKKNLNFVTRPAEAMVLASGECGASAEWEFYNDGTLMIFGSGAMDNYNAYDSNLAPWRKYNAQIKKIVIGNEVTYLGKFAFYGCSKLTTIEFEEGSSLATIGWGAFGACNSLKSVVIPACVKELDSYAFYNCAALSQVTFETGSVLEKIGDYAFWNDTALNTVTGIPSGIEVGIGAFLNTGYTY